MTTVTEFKAEAVYAEAIKGSVRISTAEKLSELLKMAMSKKARTVVSGYLKAKDGGGVYTFRVYPTGSETKGKLATY